MKSPEHVNDIAVADNARSRSSAALTLVSLAHGINHAPGALKPLVLPLVLRDLDFGYGELGIMLGVASAVGGLLQLGAGALGRILPRRQILGIGHASVGVCLFLSASRRATSVLLLDGYVDCRPCRSQSSLRNRTSVKQNPAIFNVRRDRFACEFHL